MPSPPRSSSATAMASRGSSSHSGGRLPHPDGSFDLVTMLDVIEHVDDDQTMLGEAWRVLRPGGTR